MMNEVVVLSIAVGMFRVQVKSIPGVKFFFAFVKLESVLSLLISVEFIAVVDFFRSSKNE